MDRRSARATIASSILAIAPLVAWAQPVGSPRIGFLSPASPTAMAARIDAFRQGLRDYGYREGRNITVEYRWASGKEERLGELAKELVQLEVRMVMVHGVVAAQAMQRTGAAIPIVCFACGDLIGTRLVASLARPGGNITGISVMQPEVSGKRMELLRDVVPGLRRVAVLFNSSNPVSIPEMRETESAARSFGVELQPIGVSDAGGLDAAFASMTKERAQALMVLSDAMFFGRRAQISALAASHKLPAISWTGDFARAGSLIGYGPDVHAIARRSAYYVERILKGANPAELAVEQPSKFEFVINLKTAQAMGTTVPQSLVQRADEVIR